MSNIHPKPDAIVFIPGSSRPWEGSLVRGLGDRLVAAFERNTSAYLHFRTQLTTELLPEPFSTTPIVKLSVADEVVDGKENLKSVVDLYALDLPGLLFAPYQTTSTTKKALSLGFLVLLLSFRLVRALRNENKELAVRLQLIGGAAVVLLMLLGLVFLWATLATSIIAIVQNEGIFDQGWIGDVREWALPWAGVVPAVLIMLPQNWKSALDGLVVFILGIGRYVSAGEQRDVAVGRLASFLELLAEKGQYERVHVIAYCMGSLIALDSLFPQGPLVRRFDGVRTLVTIGCPADLMRTYWPEYFTGRSRLDGIPKRWLNIFEPTDILASNFIDGDNYCTIPPLPTKKSPSWSGIQLHSQECCIKPDSNLRYVSHSTTGHVGFLLTAWKVHVGYWHPSSASAVSAFDMVVHELFSDLDNDPRNPKVKRIPRDVGIGDEAVTQKT